MSPIGRIFSVVNLVLAGLFLGWASNTLATSQAFKHKFDEETKAHATTREERDRQASELRAQLETSQSSASLLASERDNLQGQVKRLGTDLETAAGQNAEIRTDLDQLAKSLDAIQAQNRDLIAQKDQAFQGRVDADSRADAAARAEQEAKTALEGAESTNLELTNRISDFEKQVAQSAKDIEGLETQMAQLVALTGASLSDIIPQKHISGAVLKALYDVPPGLVAINKGSNDGVVRGYTWEIYDGNQYKGRVRVENVRPDMSTCIILDTVPGATIRQGDQAATVL